jgi:hypothetical protein
LSHEANEFLALIYCELRQHEAAVLDLRSAQSCGQAESRRR